MFGYPVWRARTRGIGLAALFAFLADLEVMCGGLSEIGATTSRSTREADGITGRSALCPPRPRDSPGRPHSCPPRPHDPRAGRTLPPPATRFTGQSATLPDPTTRSTGQKRTLPAAASRGPSIDGPIPSGHSVLGPFRSAASRSATQFRASRPASLLILAPAANSPTVTAGPYRRRARPADAGATLDTAPASPWTNTWTRPAGFQPRTARTRSRSSGIGPVPMQPGDLGHTGRVNANSSAAPATSMKARAGVSAGIAASAALIAGQRALVPARQVPVGVGRRSVGATRAGEQSRQSPGSPGRPWSGDATCRDRRSRSQLRRHRVDQRLCTYG